MLDVIRPHWTFVDFIGHEPEIVSIVNFTCKSGGDDLSTELLYSGWHLTLRITGWQWSVAELPARVDAVVRHSFPFETTLLMNDAHK